MSCYFYYDCCFVVACFNFEPKIMRNDGERRKSERSSHHETRGPASSFFNFSHTPTQMFRQLQYSMLRYDSYHIMIATLLAGYYTRKRSSNQSELLFDFDLHTNTHGGQFVDQISVDIRQYNWFDGVVVSSFCITLTVSIATTAMLSYRFHALRVATVQA